MSLATTPRKRDRSEDQRERRRQKRVKETGQPIKRRLALVPRGPKKPAHPLGLTDVQAKVIDALMRHGHWEPAAEELGMKGSAVRQRIVAACRKTNLNQMLLVVAWAKAKWEREYVVPGWGGLTR